MATIRIYLDERKLDEAGTAPLYLRISHGGRQRYISLQTRINPNDWHEGRERVRKTHPHFSRLNTMISRAVADAEAAVASLRAERRAFTARDIQNRVKERRAPDGVQSEAPGFLAYARERLKYYDNEGTRKNHSAGLSKFERFLRETKGTSDVPLSGEGLTPALLEEMMSWERTVLENAVNTVHKTMRTIRRFANMAIRDGYLDRSDYPFDGVELTRMRTEKTSLRPDQIRKLETLLANLEAGTAKYPEEGTLAAHVLRGFLFQLYMLGMRWGDLCTLRWEQVGAERITYRMRKTGETKDLKIVPKAAAILARYESRRGKQRYVFPLLDRYMRDPKYDMDTENGVSRAIKARNIKANEKLKLIAEAAEVDVKLTTHVARHSFAEAAMRNGWTLQEISAALGHKSVATTQAYLRSLRDDELDDKHESLF